MSDDLGPAEVTLQVRTEPYAVLVAVGLLTILIWTFLLVLGRVHLLVYLAAITLTKLLVALRLLPALARRVTVHAGGLSLVELGGTQTVRFEQLQVYYLATYPRLLPWPGTTRLVRILRLDAGRRMLRLEDDLDRFDLLLARVVTEVESRRAKLIQAQLDAGEWVSFGPLRLHRDEGLSFAGGTERWEGHPVVRHHGDVLRLGGLGVCPLGLLPLPHLLASMLVDHGARLEGVLEALEGRRPG